MMPISLQSHPKSKHLRTKPFNLYYDMAELVDDMHASGKRKFKPKKIGEVTPEPSPIPINLVLLAESTS